MHISLNLSTEYLQIFHFDTSRLTLMSSVNKDKISLEPVEYISERVRKLLHRAVLVEALESNIENRNRRSKIKFIGTIVSQNCLITDCYKFLHNKNNPSDNNRDFLHLKTSQSNHSCRFLHVSHPWNYKLIAFLATNHIQVILHSM